MSISNEYTSDLVDVAVEIRMTTERAILSPQWSKGGLAAVIGD